MHSQSSKSLFSRCAKLAPSHTTSHLFGFLLSSVSDTMILRCVSRCLVNAVNAREFCKRLEGQLAAGNNVQQCRGMVKSILRDLSLQECIKDAVLYLPASKRQVRTIYETPVASGSNVPS